MSLLRLSHEQINAHLHLFAMLKRAYEEESNCELNPLFMIADGFIAIIATMRTTFLGCPRGMCWAHIVKNVDKKLWGVRNEERRKRFRPDLYLLQLVTSPREFEDAWALSKVLQALFLSSRLLVVLLQLLVWSHFW